ncbi:hypothetical protein [Haloechinothrix sp. LS1_15]|uniref:hypothetical protein n=1 Tax=Haloechinothrix sp. LS1_15 TaxID=2652248 RepID=UPI002945A88E|nr:hypothetical protein [Haloechinothrix sp. LS1_15]MDV6013341.1 hypothetical protein [Haloechinothrix sp. LS1_15]
MISGRPQRRTRAVLGALGAAMLACSLASAPPATALTGEHSPAWAPASDEHGDNGDNGEGEESEEHLTPADVEWHDTTFTVPPVGDCPEQEVAFHSGYGEVDEYVYSFAFGTVIQHADVTGNGHQDTLIIMDCGKRTAHTYTGVVAMATEQDEVRPLGTVVDPEHWTHLPADVAVWHGDITVTMTDLVTREVWTQYHRWDVDDAEFVRVDA